MIKLRWDLNGIHMKKAEDQKVALPVEKELNEQELAVVTGGWEGGRCDWDWGCGCRGSRHRHFHRHSW